MGNCQAVDAAALVIQHPSGKTERHYSPISAVEVMRAHRGHCVCLIIPLPTTASDQDQGKNKSVHYTRVKLLRPTDTLLLGHAYRLITSQEVMKVLRAKRNAKKELGTEVVNSSGGEQLVGQSSEKSNTYQVVKNGHGGVKTVLASPAAAFERAKSWRPSLQSISEAAGITDTLTGKQLSKMFLCHS